ncbi:MAG: TOBE domain-containing protein [Paludibacterium sp.]|uniref:TOBE domain-containing protein n=1 Tax=Paludibacterium sp. TaxID=1917523 RepID=UPI0025E4120D|nr:TOBE domain-containing protein [Paludibacterium sp.]MBV8049435.1 TOBE domain-containing protein [Paludibacterium sp.]MBV8646073.1 TOBE domain-containing protein [Paludibacterium sp.]
MKTSARNQFSGKVAAVQRGSVNDEIDIEVAPGLHLVAIVTRESTDSLGLAPGVAAMALIKSSSVLLVIDDAQVRFSARNQLRGKVLRVIPGAVNSEVVVDVASGVAITAIVTNESAVALGLSAGKPVSALFKASSVIVGVPV